MSNRLCVIDYIILVKDSLGLVIIILITLTLGESSLSSESSIDLCDIIDGVVGVNGPEFSEVRTEMVP